MLNVNNFKPGVTFQHSNNIYIVLNAVHSKSARSQAHVKVKAKNLRSNAIVSLTFTGGTRLEPALIEKKPMQFLYQAGESLFFMDQNTFEQVELALSNLTWEIKFLKPDLNVELIYFQSENLGILLPDKVSLLVTEAHPAVKGDTTGKSTKKVALETGYVIDVPLFIKQDELILVDTQTGLYSGRVN